MNVYNQKSGLSGRLTAIVCAATLLGSVLVSVSDAGISRFGVHSGRIARFGSIFVNDREFDISNAAIVINGVPATESDLALGQTVFVSGQSDNELPLGYATEVRVNSPVQGVVSSIDIDAEQLTVLDFVVSIDPDTILVHQAGGDGFGAFEIGDTVEVDGYPSANGGFLATRIEQIDTVVESRVTGVVQNLGSTTLDINALTIDFSKALFIGFPSGIVSEGDNVRIHGITSIPGGELIASKLELEPGHALSIDDIGEFEGLIANFESPTDFAVGGFHITTDTNTGFAGGGPANLSAGTNVVVRGRFDETGSLLANEVTIRGTRIRIYGHADFGDASSLQVLGVPLLAVAMTELKDGSAADIEPFGIDSISSGDFIETRSFLNPPSIAPVIAERIKREDPEESVLLQGFVGVTGTQYFKVLGVTIHIAEDTEFADADDSEISSEDFLAVIAAGTFVKVQGVASSKASITASNVSLQIHD